MTWYCFISFWLWFNMISTPFIILWPELGSETENKTIYYILWLNEFIWLVDIVRKPFDKPKKSRATDVYENAIQPKPRKVAATSTIDCMTPDKPERPSASSPAEAITSNIATDNTGMPTPSPTKKACISPETKVKSKFGLVEELFGQEYTDIPTKALDRLIM